jgi:hypothetical protein
MGNMADFYNDSFDVYEDVLGGTGPKGSFNPRRTTCAFCGATGLHWEQMKDTKKWRLCNDQLVVHVCQEYFG